MKCPIDVEKKVAEMRQELHPDALVEDAYRAILGAMNGAYCDGLQGKGAPGDLAAAISDAERSLGEFAGVVQGRIDKVVRLRHQAYEQGRRDAVRLGAEEGQSMTSEEKYPNFARLTALLSGIVKRNYGFAGRRFVDELYKYGIIPQVEERYKDLFKLLSDRDTTEKQAMAAAAIICADELACAWVLGGTERPLTVDQISEFLASKATVSAGDRGYKYLCDWVTQNSNKLCTKSENPNQEVLGALEDGRAYIIRSVFERILQDAGYSTAAMISYLKQNNLIVTRGRNNTRGKRINGIPTECFCLVLPPVDLDDEDALDELPL